MPLQLQYLQLIMDKTNAVICQVVYSQFQLVLPEWENSLDEYEQEI